MFGKYRQVLLSAAILIGGAIPSGAQKTTQLSLEDAKQLGLKYNTDILNSQLDLQIAQKKIWETTATGLPHLDAKSAYTLYPKVPTLPASFFDPNAGPNEKISLLVQQNVVTDITVSQLIFNGAYFVGLQAAKVYYNISKQNDEKTRLDVIESVVNTYHMLQLGEESRKILAQNLDNINKTQNDVSEMYRQGMVEKTDVDQLEVNANTLRNALNQVESNLEIGFRLLKIQVGLADSVKIALTDSTETDASLTMSSLQLIAEPFDLQRNVDYQLTETSLEAAKLELKLEKTNSLPTINGYYDHTEKLKAPLFDFAPKDIIGVNLSLPIFSTGERSAAVAQKRFSFEKALNTRNYVSSNLSMEASQDQNDLKLKLEKYRTQKESKELSDNIYQRTLEKYKEGMSSSMDLMNSQNQYLTNLTNYYQSIYDLQVAKSKLEKLFNINQDIKN